MKKFIVLLGLLVVTQVGMVAAFPLCGALLCNATNTSASGGLPSPLPLPALSAANVNIVCSYFNNPNSYGVDGGVDFFMSCAPEFMVALWAQTVPGQNLANRVINTVTPLMLAAANPSGIAVVNALLKAGANVNAKDYSGNTALWYAQQVNATAIISALKAAGVQG